MKYVVEIRKDCVEKICISFAVKYTCIRYDYDDDVDYDDDDGDYDDPGTDDDDGGDNVDVNGACNRYYIIVQQPAINLWSKGNNS